MVKYLEVYGSQIKPHDTDVTRNMINGKHMMVVWHVYDIKLSHFDSFEVTKFAGGAYQCKGEK